MRDQGLEQAFDASFGGSVLAPATAAARPSLIRPPDIDGIDAARERICAGRSVARAPCGLAAAAVPAWSVASISTVSWAAAAPSLFHTAHTISPVFDRAVGVLGRVFIGIERDAFALPA
jgi:hypothetical protein